MISSLTLVTKPVLNFREKCVLCPSRRGFSGGTSLPPGLGHPVLDQLHHLHHQQTHPGPRPSRRLHEGGRGDPLRGRPSARVVPGRVSKVSRPFKSIIFDIVFKIWFHGLMPALKSLYRFMELLSALLTQSKWHCSPVHSYSFIDRLFDWFPSPFIHSLTYMLIFCQGEPQMELWKPTILLLTVT